MIDEDLIKKLLRADADRMNALETATVLNLPDWCIAAGFVRNLVWDHLHDKTTPTPLNDLDVVYFNQRNRSEEADRAYEAKLKSISDHPWSVKNQARMHQRNGDRPYLSTADAMSYWVEVETAVGAYIDSHGEIQLVAPFGFETLLALQITLNPKRPKLDAFQQRISTKQWLQIWPKLRACSFF